MKSWDTDTFTSPSDLPFKNDYIFVYHELTNVVVWMNGVPSDGWPYKLLKNPELIAGNPVISASLLSNEKMWPFSPQIGFILSFKPNNVIATSGRDLGTPGLGRSKDLLSQLEKYSEKKEWDILEPKEVLLRTSGQRHNEIVLAGTSFDGISKVKPIGLVLRCAVRGFQRIDYLAQSEFEEFIKKSCFQGKNTHVIPLIWELRNKFPILAYPLPLEP